MEMEGKVSPYFKEKAGGETGGFTPDPAGAGCGVQSEICRAAPGGPKRRMRGRKAAPHV